MKIINKISPENEAALADLWSNKDFQVLVKLLRQRRENLAFDCLAQDDPKMLRDNQIEAVVILRLIRSVEETAERVSEREKDKK